MMFLAQCHAVSCLASRQHFTSTKHPYNGGPPFAIQRMTASETPLANGTDRNRDINRTFDMDFHDQDGSGTLELGRNTILLQETPTNRTRQRPPPNKVQPRHSMLKRRSPSTVVHPLQTLSLSRQHIS